MLDEWIRDNYSSIFLLGYKIDRIVSFMTFIEEEQFNYIIIVIIFMDQKSICNQEDEIKNIKY
jgi:hypothetical protein